MVWATRLSFLLPIVAILMGMAGAGWWLAAVVVPVGLFSVWVMPPHQRRQVFGR
jgi:hypothetical protein